MFLVFFFALMVTLNYYGIAFALAGKIAPKVDPKMRECISFGSTYFLVFAFFLYFCLWLCAENMRLHNVMDAVGGIMGLAGGVLCSGVLMIFWFSLPFASRDFPVDDAKMFFPTHKLSLGMATFVGTRIPGGKSFHGTRFLRDIRYGLPAVPSLGDGYYVSSVPTGPRVFVGRSAGSPAQFVVELTKYLGKAGLSVPPSEKRRIGDSGRTPIFIEEPGDKVLIAVVNDRIRPGAPSDFIPDGEMGFAKRKEAAQPLIIKVYAVEKVGNIGTVIALFQPEDEELWHKEDAPWGRMQDLLPTRECFVFDESDMVTRLMEAGATDSEARQLVPLLRHGGKIGFVGRGRRVVIAEITAENKYRVFQAGSRVDLDNAPKQDRRERRW